MSDEYYSEQESTFKRLMNYPNSLGTTTEDTYSEDETYTEEIWEEEFTEEIDEVDGCECDDDEECSVCEIDEIDDDNL